MDSLIEKSRRKVSAVSTQFVRSLMGTIHWDARADLSRRAVIYHLPGLSFREYLNIQGLGKFKAYPFGEILQNPVSRRR